MKVFKTLLLILMTLALAGCSSTDENSTDELHSGRTGSIAFTVNWQRRSDSAPESAGLLSQKSPSGDVCADYLIDQVTVMILNADGDETNRASRNCSDHSVNITNVPAGSEIRARIEATVGGDVQWQGEQTGLTVSADTTTGPVEITMTYIGNDTDEPAVSSSTPSQNSTDVSVDTDISVTFESDLVPASVTETTFTLHAGTEQVDGTVFYDASGPSVTFTPAAPLFYNTTYTVTITTGVETRSGITLSSDYTYIFTTANIAWIEEGGAIVKISSAQEEILKLDEVNCTPVSSNASFYIDENDDGLWISDTNSNRVMKFDKDGNLTVLIHIYAPDGIAVDPRDGSVWVQELIDLGSTYERRLVKFSRFGHRILNTASWSGGQGVAPTDNAMTWYPGDNSLWFADDSEPPDTRTIKLFGTDAELDGYDLSSPNGGAHHLWIAGPGEFFSVSAYPGDGSGGEGYIWVGDRGNNTTMLSGRVLKLAPDGSEVSPAIEPPGFNEVRHVSSDITDGSVWIGSGLGRVAKYAADGTSLVNIGGFSPPFGTIEADPSDGGAWVGYHDGLVKLSSNGDEEWRRSNGSVDAIALSMQSRPRRTIHVSESGDDTNGDGSANLPYETIREGISEASSGDIVFVSAGTYNENIAFKNGVTIKGAGADVTTIQGLGTTNVVDGAGISNSVIEGFTITGSGSSSNGVYCADCTGLVIRQNQIVDNGDSTSSVGISLGGDSTALIEQNVISGNSSGGIFIAGDSQATIRNNIIARNGDTGIYHGGRLSDRLTTYIINNVIDSNGTEAWGRSGIMTFSDDVISNNIISNNGANNPNAGLSVGIYVDGFGWTPTVTLSYNNVWNNFQGSYTGISAGTGDISSDPQFENLSSGNYHLQSGSPSENTGDPSLFDGNVDCADSSNRRSDMGAYGGPWASW